MHRVVRLLRMKKSVSPCTDRLIFPNGIPVQIFNNMNSCSFLKGLGVVYLSLKVFMLVLVEIGIFPVLCGCWLDICSLVSCFDGLFSARRWGLVEKRRAILIVYICNIFRNYSLPRTPLESPHSHLHPLHRCFSIGWSEWSMYSTRPASSFSSER